MATVCRRASDPHAVQELWAAIRFVRGQKQIANEDRIVRHVHRECGDSLGDIASAQLHHAVADGLIVTYSAHQQKLGTGHSEMTAYRIPDEDPVSMQRTDFIYWTIHVTSYTCIVILSKQTEAH